MVHTRIQIHIELDIHSNVLRMRQTDVFLTHAATLVTADVALYAAVHDLYAILRSEHSFFWITSVVLSAFEAQPSIGRLQF